MGPINAIGTGLIPADKILGEPARRGGTANSIDTITVQHKSGGTSYLGFKSYDQGRRKFQGTSKHLIWLDEEPPADVYDECLLRLMNTHGLMLATFTPLLGLSDVAMRFLPELAPAET
jgi:phage terminase large subunit-like protein